MAISLELRTKIVEAYKNGYGSLQKIADIFGVGICTVRRCVDKARKKETLECVSYLGGRKPGVSDEELPIIEAIVKEKPESTVAQIQVSFELIQKKPLSKKMVDTALRKLNLTKKKKALWHPNRSRSVSKRGAKSLKLSIRM